MLSLLSLGVAMGRLLLAAIIWASLAAKAQTLQTAFDESGLSVLSYNGVSLIDLKGKRGDGFSVGSYQIGSRSGYGAAEKKVSWNPGSNTLAWAMSWGDVTCQFVALPGASHVDMRISVHNTSGSPLTGINIYPLGLQFPELPAGFGAPNYPQFHNNLDAPAVISADFKKGVVAMLETSAKPLYVGLSPSGPPNHYLLQVGTINDSSQGFLAKAVPVARVIAPGQTEVLAVSLRFAPTGTQWTTLASDLLENYRRAWPQLLNWKDRRPIGELFLSDPTSAPIADSRPNPRNYNFVHGDFRESLLAYADRAIRLLKSMNAQGAIIWDLEGQQYPQPDTSYAGDPKSLHRLAPEMDAVADAFFKRFADAGLKCGLTIRPQELDFTQSPPLQRDLPSNKQAANLIEKISYARKRWGCTLYYVDSDGGPNDATDPSVFAQVLKSVPDVLIIPENIWPRDYAYTAPLASFTAPYKPLHTPSSVQSIWPGAFSVTYVGDATGGDLKKSPDTWRQFEDGVKRGDILSFRAWFDDQPLNGQVRQLTGR